jgi:hypothetical protein
MNRSSGAVAPEDAEVVQVGGAIRQRAKRRGLVQGAVRLVRVIEILVLRSTVIRCRWFQIKVRSSSSRRHLPIQRSMTEFIRGAWMAERAILVPAARKTSSNAVVKLASRP